jgi:RNA polymerase sigma factor (TIGR02999 family)
VRPLRPKVSCSNKCSPSEIAARSVTSATDRRLSADWNASIADNIVVVVTAARTAPAADDAYTHCLAPHLVIGSSLAEVCEKWRRELQRHVLAAYSNPMCAALQCVQAANPLANNANSAEVTSLLKAWGTGDRSALDPYRAHLRRARHLAHRYMRGERYGHTLQMTGLVSEAFVRLVDVKGIDWQDRAHFLAVAARIMRRILVEAARTRATAKRSGGMARVEHSTAVDFDQFPATASDRAAQLCTLDDALNALSQLDPRRAQVVELRFFGGLTVEESVSPQAILRDWKLARAWLARELGRVTG